MASRRNRYKEMERNMVFVLLAALGLFLLYFIFAAFGVVWMKVILAILIILICGGSLGFLYLTQELLRKRSLYLSVSAASILLCLLVSLLLNFPAPL